LAKKANRTRVKLGNLKGGRVVELVEPTTKDLQLIKLEKPPFNIEEILLDETSQHQHEPESAPERKTETIAQRGADPGDFRRNMPEQMDSTNRIGSAFSNTIEPSLPGEDCSSAINWAISEGIEASTQCKAPSDERDDETTSQESSQIQGRTISFGHSEPKVVSNISNISNAITGQDVPYKCQYCQKKYLYSGVLPCPKYCSLCEKQIKRDAKEKASKPPTYKTYQALKNSNFKVKEIDSLNKKF